MVDDEPETGDGTDDETAGSTSPTQNFLSIPPWPQRCGTEFVCSPLKTLDTAESLEIFKQTLCVLDQKKRPVTPLGSLLLSVEFRVLGTGRRPRFSPLCLSFGWLTGPFLRVYLVVPPDEMQAGPVVLVCVPLCRRLPKWTVCDSRLEITESKNGADVERMSIQSLKGH
jgi:hypothetical protein